VGDEASALHENKALLNIGHHREDAAVDVNLASDKDALVIRIALRVISTLNCPVCNEVVWNQCNRYSPGAKKQEVMVAGASGNAALLMAQKNP